VLGRESDSGRLLARRRLRHGRWSPRDEKLGKKIWIWAVAPGMIWEKLLTDTDGIRSAAVGRSFNQAAEESTRTPSSTGLRALRTETWTSTGSR